MCDSHGCTAVRQDEPLYSAVLRMWQDTVCSPCVPRCLSMHKNCTVHHRELTMTTGRVISTV